MVSIWNRFFGAGDMIGLVRLMAFFALCMFGFGLILALIGT